MARPRSTHHLADLAFVIAFCGVMLALGRLLWRVDVLAVLFSWGVFQAGRTAPECVECGRRFFPPKKATGQAICPRCRQRALGPAGLPKERAKGLWTILLLVAVLMSLMGFGLSDLVASRFGRFNRLALPLLAAGATLGLFAAPIILTLVRNRMMVGKKYALAHARKVAGEEGEESSLGPIKLWYSGPIDPAPMLLEQMETVRGRFAAMVGEEIEVRGPLRIFRFARRDALVAFHRQTPTDLWNYDGLYNPAPARSVSLAT
jgi:DNA-directed RNA polymerase subunit RPC12/RpoP